MAKFSVRNSGNSAWGGFKESSDVHYAQQWIGLCTLNICHVKIFVLSDLVYLTSQTSQ